MANDNDLRTGRHCVFKMHVHLVFVAKYRRKVFDGNAIERLQAIFGKVCTDFEAELVEMDGEDDHVHLLVEYPPKVVVSMLVNSLEGVSSRMLSKGRPDIKRRYWKGFCGRLPTSLQAAGVLRSPSCASTSSSRELRISHLDKTKTRTRWPSALSFPALNGGTCRAVQSGTWLSIRHAFASKDLGRDPALASIHANAQA